VPSSLVFMYLESDPLAISSEERAAGLANDRHGKCWTNWEVNDIITFWFDVCLPEDFFIVAMNAPLTPKTGDSVVEVRVEVDGWMESSHDPLTRHLYSPLLPSSLDSAALS
jgi:hypothetical protein